MRANRGIVGATYYQADYDPAAQRFLEDGTQPTSTRHEPVVYYMRMDGLVKIGWTTNLAKRTQAVGPQGVMAVEFGSRHIEELRHMQFATLRSHLEWFWLHGPLVDHITQVRATFEEQQGARTERWLEEHRVHAAPTINGRPA